MGCFLAATAVTPVEIHHGADAATDPYEVSLEKNLATPAVPDKLKAKVSDVMLESAKKLAAGKLRVERLRKGEAFVVVIPSDNLFLPNDTLLRTDGATKPLEMLAPFFNRAGEYKVIIVVHSDDTGSEEYRFALTDKRVMSLYDWFDNRFTNTGNLFGYGVGSDMPEADNSTMAGRRKNRRVEIYVLPDTRLIESFQKTKN
ncbi:MAG: OmpA family protein [Muribaculaceae bacterium]|nr:OmpA family protein [Muribaculaceae bacterium]